MNRRNFLLRGFLATGALTLLGRDTGTDTERDFRQIHDIGQMKSRCIVQINYADQHAINGINPSLLQIHDTGTKETYPLHNNNGTLTDEFRDLLTLAANGERYKLAMDYAQKQESFAQSKTFNIATELTKTYEVSTDFMTEMLTQNGLMPQFAAQFHDLDRIWRDEPDKFHNAYPHMTIDLSKTKPTIAYASNKEAAMRVPGTQIASSLEKNNFGFYEHRASRIYTEHATGVFTLPPGITLQKGQDIWESTINRDFSRSVMLHTPLDMLPSDERPEYVFDIDTPFKRYVDYKLQIGQGQAPVPLAQKMLTL